MVVAALTDEGVDSHDFSVVPFPINLPELYRYYVPMEAVFFITICDAWGSKLGTMVILKGNSRLLTAVK